MLTGGHAPPIAVGGQQLSALGTSYRAHVCCGICSVRLILCPLHPSSAFDVQVPFTLSCGTPGRLRWVTTNIARFDPSIDWPTDLDCQFEWNKALKTYDGKQAHAANSIQRRGSSAAGAVCRGCWQRCRTGLQCATMRISVHDW